MRRWFEGVDDEDLYLSVLVIGEIRRGIESVRRRDETGANALDFWLRQVITQHEARILPITIEVAEVWGPSNVPDPLPVIDSLLAATARVHGLTLVTRNTKDLIRTGIPVLNPFEPS